MVGKRDDAHHCPIRRGCKRTIKPPTRRSPGTLGAGPTGASEPGKEWTPGIIWRCLSAASPVYLPISVVVAGLPSRSLARPAQGGRGKGEDEDEGKEGGDSHGEPPSAPGHTVVIIPFRQVRNSVLKSVEIAALAGCQERSAVT